MERICEWCGAPFKTKPAYVLKGGGRFCSRRCLGLSQRGPRLPDEVRAARFWSQVAVGGPDECWEWRGGADKRGYGKRRWGPQNKKHYTHRIAWMITRGDPGELDVLHRCDNPPCCNPAHLFLGTHDDNMADMAAKGRSVCRLGETHHAAKLTDAQVREIKQIYARGGITQEKLGERYGVGQYAISRITRGAGWRHVT